MTLKEIDKTLYRNHLKMVFLGIALILLVVSIATSALFIYLFSSPEVSHFSHNLVGVIVAAVFVYFILNKFRYHPYMYEVVYVWDLKQQLNRITRQLRKIEIAVENNDEVAMIIMSFMYQGSKQLYQLDDNTITIDSLISKMNVLEQRMQESGLELSKSAYDQVMLKQFK